MLKRQSKRLVFFLDFKAKTNKKKQKTTEKPYGKRRTDVQEISMEPKQLLTQNNHAWPSTNARYLKVS